MDMLTIVAGLFLLAGIVTYTIAFTARGMDSSSPNVGGATSTVRDSRPARVNSARQAQVDGLPAVVVWSIATGQMTRAEAEKLIDDVTD